MRNLGFKSLLLLTFLGLHHLTEGTQAQTLLPLSVLLLSTGLSIRFLLEPGKQWRFSQSALFLDFIAGNQKYECTPWGMPTRNVFGWQKPCYLLQEGYAKTFREMMDTTPWDQYGTGRNEKCADCMVHCGYEPTAALDDFDEGSDLLIVDPTQPKITVVVLVQSDSWMIRHALRKLREQTIAAAVTWKVTTMPSGMNLRMARLRSPSLR
mgnify:CR=1 FL=1